MSTAIQDFQLGSLTRIRLAGFIPACISALLALALTACSSTKWTEPQLDAFLSKRLPAGTPRGEVIRVVDSLRFDRRARDTTARELIVIDRDAAYQFHVKTQLLVTLGFDDSGRLTGHSIVSRFTGP